MEEKIKAKSKSSSYKDLWQAIIRPPRDIYSVSELGPAKFCLKGRLYQRTDFTLVNERI